MSRNSRIRDLANEYARAEVGLRPTPGSHLSSLHVMINIVIDSEAGPGRGGPSSFATGRPRLIAVTATVTMYFKFGMMQPTTPDRRPPPCRPTVGVRPSRAARAGSTPRPSGRPPDPSPTARDGSVRIHPFRPCLPPLPASRPRCRGPQAHCRTVRRCRSHLPSERDARPLRSPSRCRRRCSCRRCH